MMNVLVLFFAGVFVAMICLAVKLRELCITAKKTSLIDKLNFLIILLALVGIGCATSNNSEQIPPPESGIITVQPIILPYDEVTHAQDFIEENIWRTSAYDFLNNSTVIV